VVHLSNQNFDPLTNLIYLLRITHSVCAGCNIFPVLVSQEMAQLHADDDFEKKMTKGMKRL
jgi:hypothetical protein